MPDIAASVLAHLKNKADKSGKSYQLCLQLFCQEEFLRRLEKSKYADNFILKGGLFILLHILIVASQLMLISYFARYQIHQNSSEWYSTKS